MAGVAVMYLAGFLLVRIAPAFFFQYCIFDMDRILHGQIWRLFTWILFPPSVDFVYLLIACYICYILGQVLERVWGKFRLNLYFFSGLVFILIAGILTYVFGRAFHTGGGIFLNTIYLNSSFFFAFALTFPNAEFYLFFLLPIKAKYFAVLNLAFYAFDFFSASSMSVTALSGRRILIITSLIHFALFYFLVLRTPKSRADRKRQREWRKASEEGQRARREEVKRGHRCAVCGRTDQTNPELEFRYCSKCDGMMEYCMDHIFTHQHVKNQPADREE